MKADLHVHTNLSDGSLGLKETILEAKKRGITHLAITDHDTTDNLKEAMAMGLDNGISVIPGVEISAYDYQRNKNVHILGYHFDLEAKHIREICEPLQRQKYRQGIRMMEQVIKKGFPIDSIAILKRAKQSGVVYKQHIMAELVDKGYTDKIYSDLYQELFHSPGLCVPDVQYPDVFHVVKAIQKDNGMAVLAHPKKSDAFDLIGPLVEAGLSGIELNHETHTAKDREKIIAYQDTYDLVSTGGSDYHGCYGETSINIGDQLSPEASLPLLKQTATKQSDRKKAHSSANEYVRFTEEIVRKAGASLRQREPGSGILNFKDGNHDDIVTEYDVKTEEYLVEKIKEKYPDHSFITEEGTSLYSGFSRYTWVIDPIDGTTNFVNIGRDYSISVSLYIDMKPYMGVVYDVMKDEMYSAFKNEGAFLNGMKLEVMDKKKNLKDSLIDFSLKSMLKFHEEKGIALMPLSQLIRGHRNYGAASLSICKVATGELQGYLSANLPIWDYAAAVVILREAGGRCKIIGKDEEKMGHIKESYFFASSHESIEKELLEGIFQPLFHS